MMIISHKTNYLLLFKTALIALIFTISDRTFAQQKIGVFTASSDIGKVLSKGSVWFDPEKEAYTIAGSGTNIWGGHDEFHYLWKQMEGDFILQARGSLIGQGDPHRKFGWMVRNSLDTNAALVSATVHGDGLASLQLRKTKGTELTETQLSATAPDVIQLERRGNKYIMSAAKYGEPFATTEITDINIGDSVYIGLFICAHNKNAIEKAVLTDVRITVPAKENFVPYKDYIGSNIEILDINSGTRKIIYTAPNSLQAPNWAPDGKTLIYNSEGLMYAFDLKKRKPELLNTDFVKKNNNDHVLSFDGKMLGLSSSSADPKYGSVVYTVPATGGKPKQITPTGPSYLHGWSPDNKFLLFTGQRNKEFDIYKIPSAGGEEIRLTTSPGLDDGSEFTPDGRYIYFNSVRSGTMQIWRMKADGTEQKQVTSDEFNNWFPHVSPDGKWIVFVSFMKDVPPGDHPFYKHVYIRLLPIEGGKPKVIAYLYGGQGSMNTPSWSPDSKRIAFISNTEIKPE
ncbi:TolB family protein [Rubrolithibacter danxiaensis]|uniref:TolB family protein n=1 Tax=Rubrolithibacter danxiaensis TaxID=3390805 RepID=UPI003BF8ECBE